MRIIDAMSSRREQLLKIMEQPAVSQINAYDLTIRRVLKSNMRDGLEQALAEAMEEAAELPEEPSFRDENSVKKEEPHYQSLSGTPELPSSDEEDEVFESEEEEEDLEELQHQIIEEKIKYARLLFKYQVGKLRLKTQEAKFKKFRTKNGNKASAARPSN